MQQDIVLLLTGTINTGQKHFTALHDKGQRTTQYISSIRYYLQNYNFPVVFVENSGENMQVDFEDISAEKLELISFKGNDYDPALGKGLGELRCIEYAVAHSKLIQPTSVVVKITGRYTILNLDAYIAFLRKYPDTELMADLTDNFRFSISSLFFFKPFFILKYLSPLAALLNDTDGNFFEKILAKSVVTAMGDGVQFKLFKYYPKIFAQSGSTGKPYRHSFFYYLPRTIKYYVRYFIIMR